jgi:DNA invertase Pin-like site-specific DNA recombinase
MIHEGIDLLGEGMSYEEPKKTTKPKKEKKIELTQKQISQVKRLYDGGCSVSEIAKRTDISVGEISKVLVRSL